MAYFKFMVVLIAFLAVTYIRAAVVAPRYTDAHNIDDCDLSTPLNTSLLMTNVYEPAQFMTVIKRTVTFSESPAKPQVIKCIKATNLDTSNHGGYPKLVKGGVGAYDAEILITSQRGQSLNFRVEIWAK